MSTTTKLVLSIGGIFLGGMATAYTANNNASVMALVMSGIGPVAGYLIGLFQLKPGQV